MYVYLYVKRQCGRSEMKRNKFTPIFLSFSFSFRSVTGNGSRNGAFELPAGQRKRVWTGSDQPFAGNRSRPKSCGKQSGRHQQPMERATRETARAAKPRDRSGEPRKGFSCFFFFFLSYVQSLKCFRSVLPAARLPAVFQVVYVTVTLFVSSCRVRHVCMAPIHGNVSCKTSFR